MKSQKITVKNHSFDLRTSDDTTIVRGKFFNDLKDDFDAHIPQDGIFKGITIRPELAPVNSNVDPANKATMAASFLSGIITATPAGAINYTLPTGTQMETANAGKIGVNESLDFSIINIGAGGIITFVAAAGFTIVGTATVAANTSATFRVRKTATNTFVLYRIA